MMNWIGEGLLVLCISTMVPNGIACQMTIGVRGGLASATLLDGRLMFVLPPRL